MRIQTARRPASPPALAQWLVCFASGPAYEEEIAGDLCEQFQERREAATLRALWYWGQVLSSLPSLAKLRLQNMTPRDVLFEITFVTVALMVIWSWELNIAQKASWPIASQIVGYTNWSAMVMCKAIYICLYTSAVLLIFASVSILLRLTGRTQHFAQLHYLLFGLIATTPMVFYLVQPNPLGDGTGFRVTQIAAVWGHLFFSLLVGTKLHKQHDLR